MNIEGVNKVISFKGLSTYETQFEGLSQYLQLVSLIEQRSNVEKKPGKLIRDKRLFHMLSTERDAIKKISAYNLEQCSNQLKFIPQRQLVQIRLVQPELHKVPESLQPQQRFMQEVDKLIYMKIVDDLLENTDHTLQIKSTENIETLQNISSESMPPISRALYNLLSSNYRKHLCPILSKTHTAERAKRILGSEILVMFGLAVHFSKNYPELLKGWWRVVVECCASEKSIAETKKNLKQSLTLPNNNVEQVKNQTKQSHQSRHSFSESKFNSLDCDKELHRGETMQIPKNKFLSNNESEENDLRCAKNMHRSNADLQENNFKIQNKQPSITSSDQKGFTRLEKIKRGRQSIQTARSQSVKAAHNALKQSGTDLFDLFINMETFVATVKRPENCPLYLFRCNNWVQYQTLTPGKCFNPSCPVIISGDIFEVPPTVSLTDFFRPSDATAAIRLELTHRLLNPQTSATHRTFESSNNKKQEAPIEKELSEKFKESLRQLSFLKKHCPVLSTEQKTRPNVTPNTKEKDSVSTPFSHSLNNEETPKSRTSVKESITKFNDLISQNAKKLKAEEAAKGLSSTKRIPLQKSEQAYLIRQQSSRPSFSSSKKQIEPDDHADDSKSKKILPNELNHQKKDQIIKDIKIKNDHTPSSFAQTSKGIPNINRIANLNLSNESHGVPQPAVDTEAAEELDYTHRIKSSPETAPLRASKNCLTPNPNPTLRVNQSVEINESCLNSMFTSENNIKTEANKGTCKFFNKTTSIPSKVTEESLKLKGILPAQLNVPPNLSARKKNSDENLSSGFYSNTFKKETILNDDKYSVQLLGRDQQLFMKTNQRQKMDFYKDTDINSTQQGIVTQRSKAIDTVIGTKEKEKKRVKSKSVNAFTESKSSRKLRAKRITKTKASTESDCSAQENYAVIELKKPVENLPEPDFVCKHISDTRHRMMSAAFCIENANPFTSQKHVDTSRIQMQLANNLLKQTNSNSRSYSMDLHSAMKYSANTSQTRKSGLTTACSPTPSHTNELNHMIQTGDGSHQNYSYAKIPFLKGGTSVPYLTKYNPYISTRSDQTSMHQLKQIPKVERVPYAKDHSMHESRHMQVNAASHPRKLMTYNICQPAINHATPTKHNYQILPGANKLDQPTILRTVNYGSPSCLSSEKRISVVSSKVIVDRFFYMK